MNHKEYRDLIIDRIEKELIGPGSDEFHCLPEKTDEVIEGKPLQMYFSAILFPKQTQENGNETGLSNFSEEAEVLDLIEDENLSPFKEDVEENIASEDEKDELEPDSSPKVNANTFFPSHFGLSFCIDQKSNSFNLDISFGNYKKAKYTEIALPYGGDSIDLVNQFGFAPFVEYDSENRLLKLKGDIRRTVKGQITEEYKVIQASFKEMAKDHRRSGLFKVLQKLFFKTKFKRYHNKVSLPVAIAALIEAEENHLRIKLSETGIDTSSWHKDNIENLFVHVKLYNSTADRYTIKVIVENMYAHRKDQFSLSKEKLNSLALFQFEIKVTGDVLMPFRDYHSNLYKTHEDKMLDYLFRAKLTYGIGHNTSCTWENFEVDNSTPTWVKSTFIPSYNVKNQSTETDKISAEILSVKQLSNLGNRTKSETISCLQRVSTSYSEWIELQEKQSKDNEFAKENLEKCRQINKRIQNGIRLLSENDSAYEAFQLANAAIYIQMYQSEWHFGRKDGFEVFEQVEAPQLTWQKYASSPFPNGKKEPAWRPFQLAFILQCIPSFVNENGGDRELVDLLYFPTGGGKTEAYLAVSAFLIFWRRLNHPDEYGGVNIIIRYTLRLLSAQQFERASKLIFACEFIRLQNSKFGSEKISIGFWIGNATIPNRIKTAKSKYDKLLKKLNAPKFDGRKAINPFQLTNCQWCNTKLISRIKKEDTQFSIGHRIDKRLHTYCLNPLCNYSEKNGGLPAVLIDEDIYETPPTMLFGTVDKFATIAWKEDANSLFNYKNSRKPELIIQDELHLLNGPLGSLVGLFENVILSLCKDGKQTPKIIASTATVKNVHAQILGLYGRESRIFPQYGTSADDTFFSKTIEESKRRYIGILPTGKTSVMTNLHLLAAIFYGRLEVFEKLHDKKEADQYWTVLSYFKSLKEIGRFSNKITAELKPNVQQLQVRHLKNVGDYPYNYWKLPYRNLELTSRIPNERIKKNLDKLEIAFDGNLKEHKAYDFVLATNMISVGLDVGRLGIMVMNGMPPNTAEYIQASSRVARKNEGVVVAMLDPFNTRDLSYFEDFVQFHKTFYKQVEPLSVTPFANTALDKMLFTLLVAYFRHKMQFFENDKAKLISQSDIRERLVNEFPELFKSHPFVGTGLSRIESKVAKLIERWKFKVDGTSNLKFHWYQKPLESLMKPLQEKNSEDDILVAMQSMRSVEPNAEIKINQL